jgi:hypothetical protein
VWRDRREDGDAFIDRTRVLVLPSAKISTVVERTQYVIHAQSAFKAPDALVREHGQFVLSDRDNAEFWLMSRFVSETANVLHLVQDTLRPRSIDGYVNRVFDWVGSESGLSPPSTGPEEQRDDPFLAQGWRRRAPTEGRIRQENVT